MKRKNFFLLMLALVFPTIANAYDFEVDGIYYNINGNEASVTYRNTSYNSYSGNVTIPTSVTFGSTIYPVTSIDNQAFLNSSSLNSVTIPKSITSIKPNAFGGCSGLTSMVVTTDNPSYDSRNNCNAIIETATNSLISGCKNTIIPNTVTSIGKCAFNGCNSMNSVFIPNTITSIGEWAFNGCSGLTSITIPNSVKFIGNAAFMSCNGLTSIIIPDSVTTIPEAAFAYCYNLSSVSIGQSVTTIDTNAFSSCRSLTNITIPTSVNFIGVQAFESCWSLTSVTIPCSVTYIGILAFGGCNKLTHMTVESGNTKYDSRDNCNAIIETASNTLISGCSNSIIPNSVNTIGKYSFYMCQNLKNIVIPNSVTFIDDKAFLYCNNIQTITSLNDVPPLMASIECFSTVDYNQTSLLVPRKALLAYSTADYWNRFIKMEGWGSIGPGDVDGDGKVCIADVTCMIDCILDNNSTDEFYFESSDFNSNGKVDLGDVVTLIDMLINGCN